MLSLRYGVVNKGGSGYKIDLVVNFGDSPFVLDLQGQAQPLNRIVEYGVPKTYLGSDAGEKQSRGLDTSTAEDEEEKLQMALEKAFLRNVQTQDSLRSFSQYPPNIYRRSLCATVIQRAWRRHRGRILRQQLRQQQYAAATLIQRLCRRYLRKLRFKKEQACIIIQRNWRRKLFIWVALLRTKYQTSIPQMHHAATRIQRRYRQWALYKNSPVAAMYRRKIEDIIAAVNLICTWWRPIYQKIVERRALQKKHDAATSIQRVWRGHYLRQLLKPELRERLGVLGASIRKHRSDLAKYHGAFVLQRAWRNYQIKRVRSQKIKIRNMAATRIQSLWRGYWIRSHIHLRFSYGESVFLFGISKALKQCNYMLKLFKPTGIVCPKVAIIL
ncbi:hypothetical protein M427DRAFT_369481 [Gonapodya prolifera JEL478]|uniref:Uncharacterized protein n=1 Tax=Gonapodya prolifera (strain JEL478) TaxID=1344416 RepID=A0A139AAN9_GONPJ|nr:hypothetical protein M427DRAFT_369481 [Gonapodya prolifera JEL478]|eukprot:KXS13535.1 hypothetical protein M427DRAFT_369481 [Gonapodya prolifera JEL478]